VTHLTPDEIIDAAEGTLDEARRAHRDGCDLCRRKVDDLLALQREIAAVGVPEPSPLFWDHFSARVRQAVAQEPDSRSRWAALWGWPALVPLGAMAVVAAALALTFAGGAPAPDDRLVLDEVLRDVELAADANAPDDEFAVVADLVSPLDWEAAELAGLALQPGDVERAALTLTTEEQQELHRLLKAEVERPRS
jgi:hypothetical protein